MSYSDTFSKIETDDDCQVIIEKFLPKFKNHFSISSNTEIKCFLNSYENLFRNHLANSVNEYNFSKFTEELKEQLLEYCIRKIIPEYIKNPLLEDTLKKNIFSIKEMEDLATIKYTFLEEIKQVTIAQSSTIYGKTKTTGSTIPGESDLPTNESKIVIDKEKLQDYSEVISLAITKVANQLLKSKQNVDKFKSLCGIVNNNLNNIANSKNTPKEWSSIIKDDKIIANRVMDVMAKLGIIEISADCKDVKLVEHNLSDFEEKAFNLEKFKMKVRFLI